MGRANLDEELLAEIRDYNERGFVPAWIADLQVGDIFASPRMFSFDGPRQLFVVERIFKTASQNFDVEDDGEIHGNYVVNMIVTDELGLQRHLAYGHTHEIFIYRATPNISADRKIVREVVAKVPLSDKIRGIKEIRALFSDELGP